MADLVRLPLVLVVLLVVLVGCSGQPVAPRTTDAPNGATTDAPTTTPSALAPGLTDTGVTDAWALAQAHRDALANTTYTTRNQRTVRANETLVGEVTTTRRHGEGDRYSYERRTRGTAARPPNLTVFRNESTLVQRTTYDNGSVAYRGPETAATPATKDYGNVYAVLSATPTTLADTVDRNGTKRYHVTSTGPPANSSTYAGVSNYNMTAFIGPDGVVHEYIISYGTTRDGQHVTVSIAVQFTDLGETIVQPPAWVANARANTGPALVRGENTIQYN